MAGHGSRNRSPILTACGPWLTLTFPMVLLLSIAAGAGVFNEGLYRDTPYYKLMAVGQDFFSLTVITPLLIVAALIAHRDSLRALLVWVGIVTYLTYTYAIAAFDTQFNSLFLVYVALFGCSLYALLGVVFHFNKDEIKARFTERTPARIVSLYLGTLGVLFYFIWLREVIPASLTGSIPQSVKDSGTPTNAVHVLDMAWILPALFITAVFLWRKRAWGYLLAGPLLSFVVLMAAAVLSMVVSLSRAGYPVELPQVMTFVAALTIGLALLISYLRAVEPLSVVASNADTLETKVNDFLAQKRIAIAGVSRNQSHHPVGNLIYERLKKTGHDVFAVNPHMQTFGGDRCYPDLQSIPGGVDGVVIITRPETTERLVHDCGASGVRRVWMHQSVGTGSSVSPAAVEYCRLHDISVIAGACPMMFGDGVDLGHTCMRWFMKLTGSLPS